MATLTPSQYLQAMKQLETITTVLKATPLAEALATANTTITSEPSKAIDLWSGGRDRLMKDRSTITAFIELTGKL